MFSQKVCRNHHHGIIPGLRLQSLSDHFLSSSYLQNVATLCTLQGSGGYFSIWLIFTFSFCTLFSHHKLLCEMATVTAESGPIACSLFDMQNICRLLIYPWYYDKLNTPPTCRRGGSQYAKYISTTVNIVNRSLGALRAPTSRVRPFGPAW